jgi:RHS repeat-associated protein
MRAIKNSVLVLLVLAVLTLVAAPGVAAQTLPTGWTDEDLGTVGVAGSANFANNQFTVAGGGKYFTWGTVDAAHLVYQPISGDTTIFARVVSVTNSSAQPGVIIRESLNPGATIFAVVLGPSYTYACTRATTSGNITTSSSLPGTAPYWIKVVRSGNTFSGFYALDGINWVQVGSSQTISMASSAYAGLVETSGITTTTYSATFDNVSLSTSGSPAPVVSAISATTGSIGQQVVISGTGFGTAQGSSLAILNNSALTVNSWSSTSITATIPTGVTSGYLVVSVAPSMDDSNPVFFKVTTTPLPSGWLDQDVGTVGVAGTSSYSSSTFSVTGAGHYFTTGTSDGFHFVYQPVSGDATILGRIVTDSGSSSHAAVMIRESMNPGSTHASAVISSPSPVYSAFRTTTGGSASATQKSPSPSTPYWFEAVRSGNTFSLYVAADGVNWVQIGSSQIINMASNVYVGLAVTSGNTTSASTATFDNVSVNTSASPAPVISSISATNASVGEQVVIYGSGFGANQGSSQLVLNNTAVTVSSWSGSSITITIPAGATSGYLSVSVAPSMNDSNPVDFTVTPSPLPSGWLDQDVGAVGVAGSASFSSGVFSVTGAGNYVTSNSSDAFHFVYQQMTGDTTIIARVLTESSSFANAGVMLRSSLSPSSTMKAVLLTTSVGWDAYRTTTGATSSQLETSSIVLPYWVKVTRSGNAFTGYISPDGVSWTVVAGPVPVDMGSTIEAGLFVDSSSTTTAYTATFDNVSVATTSNPAPVISSISATTGAVGSQIVVSGTGFGATQSGSQVVLNDVVTIVNAWSANSITITIPTGATSGYLTVALAPDMINSNPVFFSVTSQSLPSPWLDQDVGVVGKRGSATFSGSTFSVSAAGTGVSGQADGFHFVYQPMTSNSTIQARVVSQTSGSEAGVMVRETLDAFSAEMFCYLSASGPYVTSYMNSRSAPGGPAVQGGSQSVSSPYWVRVIRSSNQFAAYISPDGVTWTPIGSPQTITTAQTVYVGLSLSSNNTATLDTASFDNVSVTPGGSLPNPVITGLSPSSGAPGQTVTITGSGFGTTPSNGTVQFNGSLATVGTWSDSQVVATVSDEATTGPVSVTTSGITAPGPTFTLSLTVQVTDSLGHQTNYISAPNGGAWEITDSQGSGCSSCTARGNYHFEFDGYGNQVWTTDPLGNVTLSSYDTSGDEIAHFTPLNTTSGALTSCTYNSFGEVLTLTDPLGHVTTNTYDTHGNLLTVTTPQPNSTTAASVTHFAYNSLGELTQITDPLSRVTMLTYTTAGYIATITDPQSHVTTYGYDSRGNRTSVADALNNQTTFTYDAGNHLTKITYPDSTTMTFTYDVRGRRTSVTDQNEKTTTYAYDDADRLTSTTDPASNVTQYSYDTENNLLSITDANGHETSLAYDAFGRIIQTTFPSNLQETYTYDADNNIASKTDRKGQTIQYLYDALNRLVQKSYPDSTSAEYTYDLVGKVLQVNDPTGTYSFSYDNMGRLIGTTTSYSFLTSRNFTTSYAYDANSNRTGFTDPEGGSTSYSYDTLNRLSTLMPPTAFGTGSFGFAYDALNRRTQLTRPNTVATNYTYDNMSRYLSVVHQKSGSTIDGATYTLDAAGNRTSKTDLLANVTSSYGYDPIYGLTSVIQGTSATETYTYDPAGNRMSSQGISSYSYNSSNEVTSTSNRTYAYDYNGNATSKTDSTGATGYSWSVENRLTSVTLPGSGGTVTFKYDPFGRRIYKSSSSGTSIYAYDSNDVIEETNAAGAVVARYARTENVDDPLAMLRSATTSYYQTDALGSVTSLSNASGSLVQTYAFDSYGNSTSSSGSVVNSFQYNGRELDSETGLYYYRVRYFDPNAGRFVSEDPARFVAANNFYAYVNNNPGNFVDPYGLRCWSRIALITAYSDQARTSGQGGKSVMAGLGIIAEANHQDPLIYPFGCSVTVSSSRDPVGPQGPFPAYRGIINDTGAGWNKTHHNVAPDQWFDIWLPTRTEANNWGIQWRQVTICCPDNEPSCPLNPIDKFMTGGSGFDNSIHSWPSLSLASGFQK